MAKYLSVLRRWDGKNFFSLFTSMGFYLLFFLLSPQNLLAGRVDHCRSTEGQMYWSPGEYLWFEAFYETPQNSSPDEKNSFSPSLSEIHHENISIYSSGDRVRWRREYRVAGDWIFSDPISGASRISRGTKNRFFELHLVGMNGAVLSRSFSFSKDQCLTFENFNHVLVDPEKKIFDVKSANGAAGKAFIVEVADGKKWLVSASHIFAGDEITQAVEVGSGKHLKGFSKVLKYDNPDWDFIAWEIEDVGSFTSFKISHGDYTKSGDAIAADFSNVKLRFTEQRAGGSFLINSALPRGLSGTALIDTHGDVLGLYQRFEIGGFVGAGITGKTIEQLLLDQPKSRSFWSKMHRARAAVLDDGREFVYLPDNAWSGNIARAGDGGEGGGGTGSESADSAGILLKYPITVVREGIPLGTTPVVIWGKTSLKHMISIPTSGFNNFFLLNGEKIPIPVAADVETIGDWIDYYNRKVDFQSWKSGIPDWASKLSFRGCKIESGGCLFYARGHGVVDASVSSVKLTIQDKFIGLIQMTIDEKIARLQLSGVELIHEGSGLARSFYDPIGEITVVIRIDPFAKQIKVTIKVEEELWYIEGK